MRKGIVVDDNGDASTCLIGDGFEVGDNGIFNLVEGTDSIEGMIVHIEEE